MPSEVPTRWLSATQLRIWRAHLVATARLSELLDADLRRHGLDLAEYEILVTLEETAGRRLRMSELADAVHQSRSRLTHTVSRMERQALVERVSCPSDRRGVWAQLTEQGIALLTAAAPRHVACVREHFVDPVSHADLAALGRAYDAMMAAMDATRSASHDAPTQPGSPH
jgi:DNA-binding MarR family transcriptional regulator